MTRGTVLGAALAVTALLALLTVHVLFSSGLDVLVVLTFIVLALFTFGIFGALGHPPEDG